MEYFEELGQSVEDSWRAAEYDDECLSDIASTALSVSPPHQSISQQAVIQWALSATSLPRQLDPHAQFGQPPITVFSSDRLKIQVLFWFDASTDIHQHGFSGAWTLLSGSSLHCEWTFDDREELSTQLELGRLHLQGIEMLKPGNTRQIRPGRKCIHSVLHLDRPTVSIVVRSSGLQQPSPQLHYFGPALAVHKYIHGHTERRQLELLELLARADRRALSVAMSAYVESVDLAGAVRALLRTNRVLGDVEPLRSALRKVDARHTRLAHGLNTVLSTQTATEALSRWSVLIEERDHRLFLALLLNVPDPRRIREFIQKTFPDVSWRETILLWAEHLRALETSAGLAGSELSQKIDFVLG